MILSLISTSIQAIIEIFLVIIAGMLCAHFNILNSTARDGLSSLIVLILTPCLLVTSLAQVMTVNNLIKFWVIPVCTILYILIGTIVSNIVFRVKFYLFDCSGRQLEEVLPLLKEKKNTKYDALMALTLTCMFKNITSIPLPLVTTIVENNSAMFQSEDSLQYAISIVLIYASIANIIAWSFGSLYVSSSGSIKETIKLLLSIPNLSVILGVIVGLTPILRNLFYPSDAIFYNTITRACEVIGSATSPCMLILFGGLLYETIIEMKTQKSVFGFFDIILMILVSLILLPSILYCIIYGAWYINIIPNDKILLLVLFVQASTPSSMNSPLLCDSVGNKIARGYTVILMLYQYLASVVTLVFLVTLSLYLLSSIMIKK